MGSLERVQNLCTEFEETVHAGEDVTHVILELAEIFEQEAELFLRTDPDPFDHRFPSCTLGDILTAVFEKKEAVVDPIVEVYTRYEAVEMKIATCRFLLSLFPVYDSGFYSIFGNESFVLRIYEWVENDAGSLKIFATGLLAEAMNADDISNFKENNTHLFPIMVRRLHELSNFFLQNVDSVQQIDDSIEMTTKEGTLRKPDPRNSRTYKSTSMMKNNYRYNPMFSETKSNRNTLKMSVTDDSFSNKRPPSSWGELMFGSHQSISLTLSIEQKYILKYLNSVGEYEYLLGHVVKENALALVIRYIDLRQNPDFRLAFDALQYLSCLLCHTKLAIEFMKTGGLEIILKVPRPSVAAAGVSVCLSQLARREEAMERISVTPSFLISDMVSYALWFLECSHKSCQCYATKFLGYSFIYKGILNEFDNQDGLRKLLNVMGTLNIFNVRHQHMRYKSTVKCVCESLKKYFEAHLDILIENKGIGNDMHLGFGVLQDETLRLKKVEHNMRMLQDLLLTPLNHWKPVSKFCDLGGINLLLTTVSSYSNDYLLRPRSSKVDVVRSALDVLKICALTVSSQLKLCEEIPSLHDTGINILLQAAEGKLYLSESKIRISALLTIINCVCTKIPAVASRFEIIVTLNRNRKKLVENLLQKVWDAVRRKNGIGLLVNLLYSETIFTEADCIRALASKALCGLSRLESVLQILCKLPLIEKDELANFMKEPLLPNTYQYHAQFCKYGIEIIQRVTNASVSGKYQSYMNKFAPNVLTKKEGDYNDKPNLLISCDNLSKTDLNFTASDKQHETEEYIPVCEKSLICFEKFPSVYNISWKASGKKFLKLKNSRKLIYTPQILSYASTVSSSSAFLKADLNENIKNSAVIPLTSSQENNEKWSQSLPLLTSKQQDTSHPSRFNNLTFTADSIVSKHPQNQNSPGKRPSTTDTVFALSATRNRSDTNFQNEFPVNYTVRSLKRETGFQTSYRDTALNLKHIYSRFKLQRIFKQERLLFPTKCAFVNNDDGNCQKVAIGTLTGQMKVFNVNTGKQIYTKNCHDGKISHIESKKSTALLISSSDRQESSKLWNTSSGMQLIHTFDSEFYMEFSKCFFDRVIGTQHTKTVIYDINTFSKLQSFSSETLKNNCRNNAATFDFSDNLILTNGNIYDLRSGDMMHRLDKLDSQFNGVFHPNGREIIFNSEVWDIRTFKLLRNVPCLNQCRVTFNQPGSVMYAVRRLRKEKYFFTLDAFSYNTISTVDVGRSIFHLDCDLNDRYIATVVASSSGYKQVCRLYQVGQTKHVGDCSGDETDKDSDDNIGDWSSLEDADEILTLDEEEDSDVDQNDEHNEAYPEPNDDEDSEDEEDAEQLEDEANNAELIDDDDPQLDESYFDFESESENENSDEMDTESF